MGSRELVVLANSKHAKSAPLDPDSKAVQYLLSRGWKIVTRMTLVEPEDERHINYHPSPENVTEVTQVSLVTNESKLQHEELKELNEQLSEEAVKALVEAKLDSPQALAGASQQKLVELGLTRVEARKIQRFVKRLTEPKHGSERAEERSDENEE